MNIEKAAIILARMDSERLPGKALTSISGKPLIEWCVSGLSPSGTYETILATTDRPEDDLLVEWAIANDLKYFRGDSKNVAKRVSDCLRHFEIKYFARINGDSPFVNKPLLIRAFELLEQQDLDFVTNLIPRAFPYGVSVEVIKSATFLKLFSGIRSNADQEHITSYFYKNLELFNYFCLPYNGTNDHDVRLVVDVPDDRKRIENLLKNIPENKRQSLDYIVAVYNNLFGGL